MYFMPFSIAFLAMSPAASITSGLDVFVQDVIAAITTDPFLSSFSPSDNLIVYLAFSGVKPNPLKPTFAVSEVFQSSLSLDKGTRSCGLLGPDIAGSTSSSLSSSTLVY
jgi:hypothetical protein